MIHLHRTTADNPDFKKLVDRLNRDLASRHGADHPLAQFNPVDDLKYVLVAYDKQQRALGCGAIGRHDPETMEIKRMYVRPEARGQRLGKRILTELEQWTLELKSTKSILFMGVKQPEAT
ncbi:MAG: GNAT family N-acetyltransferase, partial [Bacteroidota bacterium]